MSRQSPDADHFEKGDWAHNDSIWSSPIDWQANWDSDEPDLPEEMLSFLDWEDNTTVFSATKNTT